MKNITELRWRWPRLISIDGVSVRDPGWRLSPGGIMVPRGGKFWTPKEPNYYTTTFTPTKTIKTDLLAWQDIASTAGTCVNGTSQDCSGVFAGAFSIKVGRQSGSAFTAGYPNILIQGSLAAQTPRNDQWVTLYPYPPQVGASIANTTLSSGITAGDATFAVASATNIAAGDILYLKDSSAANYELIDIASVSGTTITPAWTPGNNHASGQQVTDQGERVSITLGLQGYNCIRAIVQNQGGGQAFAVEVKWTAFANVSGA